MWHSEFNTFFALFVFCQLRYSSPRIPLGVSLVRNFVPKQLKNITMVMSLRGGKRILDEGGELNSESAITPDSEEERAAFLRGEGQVNQNVNAEEILPDIPGLRGLGIKTSMPRILNTSSYKNLANDISSRVLRRGLDMSEDEMLQFVRGARDQGLLSDLVENGEVPASFIDFLDEGFDEIDAVKSVRDRYDIRNLRKMYLGTWSTADQERLDEMIQAAKSRMAALNLPLQIPDVVPTLPAAIGKHRNRFCCPYTVIRISSHFPTLVAARTRAGSRPISVSHPYFTSPPAVVQPLLFRRRWTTG